MQRSTKPARMLIAVTAALAVPALAVGAAAPATSAATAQFATGETDPFNVVYETQFENGKFSDTTSTKLDDRAFTHAEPRPKDVKEDEPREPEKIQPALARLLESGDAKDAQVLVTYKDPLDIPTFPMPAFEEGRDSATNQRALERTQELIGEIENERAGLYKEQAARIEQFGGRVSETYWLIQGVQASLPVESVAKLADQDDVQYVELADLQFKPPADANNDNDVIDARAQLNSDPYFNLGQTSGWIGLLDTGVRTTHNVFNSPDHIAITQDVTGDGDPTDQCNHGTASAALITGNDRLGGNWRGLSAISLDSFDVYGNDCGVSSSHAVDGFQKAVSWLDKVIVAELQIDASETSAVSKAADAAFDAGSVVVAANGNFGSGASTVRAPANAHKVLGIGAADLQTDTLMSYSGRGPTSDSRYKPDLVFPTNVETARSGSDTAMGSFGGTSCATPIAGGAVALMRNWMRSGTGVIDPGYVYSQSILNGQTQYPFNNDTGAGPFVLGVNGHSWWGKVSVGNKGVVNIPINVAAGKTKFEGSLWWPEGTSTHNDVDLALVSPSGSVYKSSISAVSVFERASVLSGLYAGTWTLRISGYSVSGSQPVYWSGQTR